MEHYTDSIRRKHICRHCVREQYLSEEIAGRGELRACSYCGRTARSYSIGRISERIETAFEEHYVRTSSEPDIAEAAVLSDPDSNYDWERGGEPTTYAIMGAAQISEQAAADIQTVLEEKHADIDAHARDEETEFAYEAYYDVRRPDDARWHREWLSFEEALKTEARFFSQSALAHLSTVFADLASLRGPNGREVLLQAGPGTAITALFRARVFQSEERLEDALAKPERHLGPPPPRFAAAGRMNAQGISVFYGSLKPMVALAEVRPPVGSSVVVARFEISRRLQLLDLTALEEATAIGSIFDPRFRDHLDRSVFLSKLSRRMVRAVMPDDEPLEYLATQAIADFLATENQPALDGIIFPSVQAGDGALNVVLFHKAADVEPLELPDGVEITVSSGEWNGEEWKTEYTVFERKRNGTTSDSQTKLGQLRSGSLATRSTGLQGWYALHLDLDSIYVHRVHRVKYDATSYRVSRLNDGDEEIPF